MHPLLLLSFFTSIDHEVPKSEVRPAAITVAITQEVAIPEPWGALADCESGNWVDGGQSFEEGSARWQWAKPGVDVPSWGTTIHHGGLQFHPDTWNWVAPMVGLGHVAYAYDATPQEQIRVAEKVQELQGWKAWPTCARMLGLY